MNYILNLCLLRILLPAVLTTCVAIRQDGVSFIYLILLLYLPFVSLPTSRDACHAGRYLKGVIATSGLVALGKLIFQIVLLSMPPYASFLPKCEELEAALRIAGLIRLDSVAAVDCMRWVLPEALLLASSLSLYIVCARPKKKDIEECHTDVTRTDSNTESQDPALKSKFNFLTAIGKYVVLCAFCVTGAVCPSVLNMVYYLSFIIATTYWSCYKQLAGKFAVVCRVIQTYAALHLLVLFLVQVPWPEDWFMIREDIGRYLALKPVYKTNCTDDPRTLISQNQHWSIYANPLAVLILYFILGYEYALLRRPTDKDSAKAGGMSRQLSLRLSQQKLFRNSTSRWRSATRKVRARSMPECHEETPLIQGAIPNKYQTTRRGQGSSLDLGAISVIDGASGRERAESIQLFPITDASNLERSEDLGDHWLDKLLDSVVTVFQLIIRSSYIVTNIIMMTWSITYHSWLTFFLLLWASILWMVPNQRRWMLHCSPFLVTYALFLLIAQYVYSLDLTELPENVNSTINLKQIGFEKPINVSPSKPVLIKSLYTVMFWITLRQYMQERWQARNTSALADMAAPLQITVTTATSGMQSPPPAEAPSPFMRRLGIYVKELLTKFWIWVVAIMLFVIGITGDKMTGFRIVYMGLFLVFILTFKLSYKAWRRMLYGFWLTVIVFSMIILVLIYTYQFDNFNTYWDTYLGIPEQLQADIGLQKFHTKDLFVRLITPTFFVIITAIQMNYFHKDFLAISDIKSRGVSFSQQSRSRASHKSDTSSEPGAPARSETDGASTAPSQRRGKFQVLRHISSLRGRRSLQQGIHLLKQFIELVWLFLELHISKLMLLTVMLLCIAVPCALHFPMVLLVVVSLAFSSRAQEIACNICSVWVALLMLGTMIYQIEYIDMKVWDYECIRHKWNTSLGEKQEFNITLNNALWLGFRKADSKATLSDVVKGYIGVILVASFVTVVNIHQTYKRSLRGRSISTPQYMFPRITRADADKNILNCVKYILNYGFYRFGIEICMVAMVALIGTRVDFYAMLHAIWLLAMFAMKRERIARLWTPYISFIIICLIIQYIMVVDVPPSLCVDYPWDMSDMLKGLQEWMFLPDPINKPEIGKIACDFILLMFVSCQGLAFRIERKYPDNSFPGGSNASIIHEYDNKDFVNPVPDYISSIRSWLDVVKRGVLLSMMWLTLAIMFLAGTNRVNLFSLGYLIGAFVFLWMGSDLYLRDIRVIHKWWNALLGYNVAVIFLKTLLQVIGCIFMEQVQSNACWFVQLMGIACIRKFHGFVPTFIGRPEESSNGCTVHLESYGLAWDGVCFGFLLLQRRLFQSYYFFHIVDETKAMTILASRGAELIEELRQKQIMEQMERENQILENIKLKMERIKASQMKVQGPSYREPSSHFTAVLSGDYYMFEDMPEADLVDPTDVGRKEDDEAEDRLAGQLTISKLFSEALKTDIKQAVDKAHASSATGTLQKRASFTTADSELSCGSRGTRRSSRRSSQRSAGLAGPDTMPTTATTTSSAHLSPDGAVLPQDARDGEDPGDQKPLVSSEHGSSSDGEELEADEVVRQESWLSKISQLLHFLIVSLNSIMVSLTRWLNTFSRDYRYVSRVLAVEKKLLKEEPDFGEGKRVGLAKMWQPSPQALQVHRSREEMLSTNLPQRAAVGQSNSDMNRLHVRQLKTALCLPSIRVLAPSLEVGLDECVESNVSPASSSPQAGLSSAEQPPVVQLLLAVWYTIVSHSDLACFFMIFLHQMKSATILSIPLPLMVFLWGTLTVPRPSTTFWVVIIAYTEVMVVIKCMFQFDLLPWNHEDNVPSNTKNPFWPPRIIGIEKKPNYAVFDLSLLLVLFFHRFMLKSLGLWKSLYEDDSTYPQDNDHFEFVQESSSEERKSKQEEHDKKRDDKIASESADSVHTTHSDPGVRRVSIYEPGMQLTHRGSLKTFTLSDGRRISMIRPSWLEDGDRQRGILTDTNQEVLVDGSVLDGMVMSPVESNQSKQIVVAKTFRENAMDRFPSILKLTWKRYMTSMRTFFKLLLDPGSRVNADVYAYMFMCDFFNFMVVIFGFSAFGSAAGGGSVSEYFEENKVPVPFLVMLILQFALIIIDRTLYLRKYILGKIIFQCGLVVGIHIWMFFILPGVTERKFNETLPPQMWYVVKCFYLLLSAYQIRSGYPTRILGNFLCKAYNYLNMYLFKVFMTIPFVFELRAIMDWMWTDTSMSLMEWLKMEDIFSQLFQLKCERRAQTEYPQPRGVRKNVIVKYLVGGLGLLFIIAIIWFPLVLFALGNTVGSPNLPLKMTLRMRLGHFEPIYDIAAEGNQIREYNENQWRILNGVYRQYQSAQNFLSNYDNQAVAMILFNIHSGSLWTITPPDLIKLREEVASDMPFNVTIDWRVERRQSSPEDKGYSEGTHTIHLPAIDPKSGNRNTVRQNLQTVLEATINNTSPMVGNSSSESISIVIPNLLPKLIKVNSNGANPILQLLPGKDADTQYRDVILKMNYGSSTLKWWTVLEDCNDQTFQEIIKNIPSAGSESNCNQTLLIYTFNDKTFPATLSMFSGKGIIGLYASFVLVASQFVRSFFSNLASKIMFEDLPNVDRILQLCLDIYLVRESGELDLEEDLFAKLVFLYRSPETMIEWTRERKEGDDRDSPEASIAQE
ncbi:piezo-type mechanosensitive ion channel component isoform X3 [Frankliniella occidentalis]|uniref:Piezo-type mechanosensitive ion channel component isoform X3 n=1 Tax=Frankliniella occidentalis TaxID=133901 RepID=A0A9C6TYP5_FRAOC|nr:piezo-type mechanosensitive ion channel component isoform X3 [Frankliniella occidentalis]